MTDSDSHELSRLIARLSDGQLTEAERERLNELLKSDPVAQEAYLDHMAMDACLEREFGAAVPVPGRPEVRPFWLTRKAWLSAAATVLVVAGACLFAIRGFRGDGAGVELAHLSETSNAVWAEGGFAPAMGDGIRRGPLQLVSGTAQLIFANGVTLTMTGPTNLELQGPTRIFLHRGRIVPYVPPAGRGFTVLSPAGRVVDLGTEFSLDVEPSGVSKVHVIDGAVRVENDDGSPSTNLTAGYAVSLKQNSAARLTQVPLVVDRFDVPDGSTLNESLDRRQSWGRVRVGYVDLDPDAPSRIGQGMLGLQIAGRPGQVKSACRVALDRDFQELVGRRYSIAFKVRLPDRGTVKEDHWVALVLWDDPATGVFPLAFEAGARLAVLLNLDWQVGVRSGGEVPAGALCNTRVFARSDAAGPYQVLLRVDETGAVPSMDLIVNGASVAERLPVKLGRARRLGFHSWTEPASGPATRGSIGDLRISIEPSLTDRREHP